HHADVPSSPTRRSSDLISGGSGTNRKYTYLMPQCPTGSHLSMRLENVINALEDVRQRRITAARWDSGGTRNNYYSDTVERPGQRSEEHTSELHPRENLV